MQFLPHFLIGMVIVYTVPYLPLALVLAFISHLVLDAIPHWDPAFNQSYKDFPLSVLISQSTKVRNQLLFSALFHLFILSALINHLWQFPNGWQLILGGFAGILPDFYEWVAFVFGLPRLHVFRERHVGSRLGLATQMGIVIFALWSANMGPSSS